MYFESIEDEYLKLFIEKSINQDENLGFLKGNMFDNEYVPFKNYTYIKPKLKNEREKELFNIMAEEFAINDYNLYLDLFPNDNKVFVKYQNACKKLHELTKKYEEKYGPLNLINPTSSYKWDQGPWPWDKEDSKYV